MKRDEEVKVKKIYPLYTNIHVYIYRGETRLYERERRCY